MTLLDPQPRPLDDPGRCNDAELIAAVRAGDRAAYAQLYERHEPAARRMARQLSPSPHDVDDLVAEAFARVFDVLSSGRGPDSAFRAYLLTAVRNGMYERARRDRRLELSEDMGRHDHGVPWVDPVEAELNSALAARAFASLPERWRTVLWYSEIEQESTAKVGSRLGLRPNAVAALAYRAREGLRQAFLQAHVTGCDDDACRDTVNRLGSWTRDRLSSGDAARVDAHLASCRRCRQVAAELEEVNSGLRGLLAPLLLGAAGTGSLASLLRGSSGAVSSGAVSSGAVSSGAVSSGAVSSGAVSSGAASAGAASAGAVSGGAAGAAAGASVLGWLAGAYAGPAAAVLTAVVVGGTAVAAGVAMPHVLHRSPAASAVSAAEAGGGSNRTGPAPVPSGGTAEIVTRNTAATASKQARAAASAAKKRQAREQARAATTGTAPNSANAAPNTATRGPAAGSSANGPSDQPKSPQATVPGRGQTDPPKSADAPADGQPSPPTNAEAVPAGNGQTENAQAVATASGRTTSPKSAQASAPGTGQTAAAGKGNARAAGGGRG